MEYWKWLLLKHCMQVPCLHVGPSYKYTYDHTVQCNNILTSTLSSLEHNSISQLFDHIPIALLTVINNNNNDTSNQDMPSSPASSSMPSARSTGLPIQSARSKASITKKNTGMKSVTAPPIKPAPLQPCVVDLFLTGNNLKSLQGISYLDQVR